MMQNIGLKMALVFYRELQALEDSIQNYQQMLRNNIDLLNEIYLHFLYGKVMFYNISYCGPHFQGSKENNPLTYDERCF